MKIKISNLAEGIHELQLSKSVKELNLDKPFKNNLKLDCTIDKSVHQIVVNCNLSADADFICDRCGENYSDELHHEFRLVYLFEKNIDDIESVNIKYVSGNIEELNLTQDAIDYAYLSVPMKKLCSDDCLGLCPDCGVNLNKQKCSCKIENINPVWEKLLNLKDNLN